MVDERSLHTALHRLDQYVVARDYAGPDPYDGLLSPYARRLSHPRARQAVVQLVKRAPVNPRRMLRIPPVRMAKALALFTSGLLRLPELPDAASRADMLLTELNSARSWGYEFDVQTRWAFYPARSPNIIATSFVVEALYDGGRLQHGSEIAAWLLTHMVSPEGFIRYTPGSDRLIHNANVLGARALSRIVPEQPEIATAVERTLAAQRADGTWMYGEGRGLSWVDNFHTAYVLFALRDLRHLSGVAEAVERGVNAWVARCFDSRGLAMYNAAADGPLDVHNIATAVYTLSIFAAESDACAQLLPIVTDQLLGMQRRNGAFVARQEPPYMRWNQAHAYRALAEAVGVSGGTVGR